MNSIFLANAKAAESHHQIMHSAEIRPDIVRRPDAADMPLLQLRPQPQPRRGARQAAIPYPRTATPEG